VDKDKRFVEKKEYANKKVGEDPDRFYTQKKKESSFGYWLKKK